MTFLTYNKFIFLAIDKTIYLYIYFYRVNIIIMINLESNPKAKSDFKNGNNLEAKLKKRNQSISSMIIKTE